MAVHQLKTWPEFFQAILDGNKRHEIRKNDRDFHIGDVLMLREYDPSGQMSIVTGGLAGDGYYSGRIAVVIVSYITEGGSWGLPSDLCVMSISSPCATERARQADAGERGQE